MKIVKRGKKGENKEMERVEIGNKQEELTGGK